MHRKNGNIIYVGKSKNIRKRLIQHFTNDNKKSKKIQSEVVSVSYEETGNDLIAQLKESHDSLLIALLNHFQFLHSLLTLLPIEFFLISYCHS